MPIYEYRCGACGHQIEVIQKLGDPAPRKCSRCAGTLKKLISRTAFQLKGGGWCNEGYSKGEKGQAKPTQPEAKQSEAKKPESRGSGSATDSSSSTPRKAASS